MVLNTMVTSILRYRFSWVDYVEFSEIFRVPMGTSNQPFTILLVFICFRVI